MTDEQDVVLEVKLSLIVTASVGEGNPLEKRGVAELVHRYLHDAGVCTTEELIDSVTVIEFSAANGRIIAGPSLGDWAAARARIEDRLEKLEDAALR